MNKNELSIMEIYENLNEMGYNAPLEVITKMKPTELKKFYKKARKAFELYYSIERTLCQLSTEEVDETEQPKGFLKELSLSTLIPLTSKCFPPF